VLIFGLIHDSGWEPPDQPPEQPPPRPHRWRLPWRPLAWVAAFCWLMALGLVLWRAERWCAKQYWSGLREYKL
jgi:hypothetical protein